MGKFQPDDDLIRRLAALLEETGLSEIEYEANGQRIRVGRQEAPVVGVAPAAAAPITAPAAGSEPAAEAIPAGAVTSPMVGTVYTASEPGSPAFVKVGDSVSEGQTLLIIEAMKVMNPLASPSSGKVTRILITDGQPVEFGEPLLIIE
ncbi:MAG: acetyl-CoA carboxylase biotin carboxyl carrier protein [Alphaproteobacteria bacterium]